jgi:hypothetical protein
MRMAFSPEEQYYGVAAALTMKRVGEVHEVISEIWG